MILTPKNWKSFQHYKDRDPPWIKLHRGLLNNYEFFSLPVASKALAPLLWLIASENEDGRIVTSLDALAFRLHMTRGDLADALSPLVQAGFFETSESLEQVASTAPAIRSPETEAQVKTEANSRSVADATRPSGSAFDEFWKAYPRRDGPNPRKPAETKFNALAKTGVDPAMMIAAVKRMAAEQFKDIGTRFIPQAITWLNQQRWADHAVEAFTSEQPVAGFYVKFGSPEQDAWDAYRKTREGKPYPRDGKGGWHHPTQWPPGHEQVEAARSEPPVLRMQSI